jgi:integrase/recombinase XerD
MSETTSRPISPLRQRMLDEMRIRQFSDKTQADYIRHVETLTRCIGRSPASATPDDLRAFQVRQRQNGGKHPARTAALSGADQAACAVAARAAFQFQGSRSAICFIG